MKRRLEASLANQAQSPGAVYGERVRRVNTLDHYSARALRLEDLPRLDPEKMLSFYKEVFANAANFTFFFVGTFTVDAVTPLVEQYLGSLPSKGSPDRAKARCGWSSRARSFARPSRRDRSREARRSSRSLPTRGSRNWRLIVCRPRPKCWRSDCAISCASSSAAPTRLA